MDPTIINDKPYYPREDIHTESPNCQGDQPVLVVVDTVEGRRWHIESKSSNPAYSKHLHTTRSAEQNSLAEEQTVSGSTKTTDERNESVAQKISGDHDGSNLPPPMVTPVSTVS